LRKGDSFFFKRTMDIISLPRELVIWIMSFLNPSEIAKMSVVCSMWSVLALDDMLWERKFVQFFGEQHCKLQESEKDPWHQRFKQTLMSGLFSTVHKAKDMVISPDRKTASHSRSWNWQSVLLDHPEMRNGIYYLQIRVVSFSGNCYIGIASKIPGELGDGIALYHDKSFGTTYYWEYDGNLKHGSTTISRDEKADYKKSGSVCLLRFDAVKGTLHCWLNGEKVKIFSDSIDLSKKPYYWAMSFGTHESTYTLEKPVIPPEARSL